MKWPELDKDTSLQVFEEYCQTHQPDCPEEYRGLQEDIRNLFVSTLSELGIGPEKIGFKNYKYQVDYIFGLKLFSLLNEKYGMNVRTAATPGVWRFINLRIVPDVIEMRYSIEHADRYWKKPKRLWLRTLWWYIYLSWQGSEESTREVLKDNSTDEIAQLVDRCGRGGYRVELYRQLMKLHSTLDPVERRQKAVFRKMMVLNTARVQVIAPELVDGGESQYVKDLCSYFMKT